MKVIRNVEIETDRFEVGDQIEQDIDGAIYTATCQRVWTDENGDACAAQGRAIRRYTWKP